MSEASKQEAPVLIAGGGLIGLSSAMFLAQHGISSIAVERLKATSPLPRAAFFHMRTMEMFRGAGIESDVMDGSRKDFVPEGKIILMDTVAGKTLADIIGNLNESVETVSPCKRLFLNQPNLEPILEAKARAGGASLLRGYEVAELSQDSTGVDLRIRHVDTGEERTLRGKYLIAADGAHSKVRDLLGIEYDGRGVFSNSITIYFTADLSSWLGEKPISIVYVNNPEIGGFFRMNRAQTAGFLVVNTVGDPSKDPAAASNAAVDMSEARMIEYVCAGVGVPDLRVRIDGVARWRATADVATRFRNGRIFIAGDAAHLMPPNGGFGGNTGIHDAHNLAWKLAAILKDQAGEALLDTYETERKPVAKFTVEQAFSRYVTRTAPWLRPTQKIEDPVHDFRIEIGYRYHSPAVIGSEGGEVSGDPRESYGAPGTRVPHIWLKRNGKRLSTIDLTGRFLLLVGKRGEAWMTAVRDLSTELALPVDSYRVGNDVEDPSGELESALGISEQGASLIRPDGFVAWRSTEASSSAQLSLRKALMQVLAR